MDDTNSAQSAPLRELLAQRVEIQRADLVARYQDVLQESLFTNRAFVRPSMLKQIAADEAEALLNFLRRSGFYSAEHGKELYQSGFNIASVLKLSQTTCQFLLDCLEDHQVAFMLDILDSYRQAVTEGYIISMEEEHRIELEQTRNALQRGIS